MKSYSISAFAVPVAYGSFGESARPLNKALVDDILHCLENHNDEKRSGVGVRQTMLGLEKHYESFDTLAGIMAKFLKQHIQWSGVKTDSIIVKELWANVNNDPAAFHMPHSHGLKTSLFTGVYFPSSGIQDDVHLSESENLDNLPDLTSKTQPNPGDLVLLDPIEFVKTSVVTPNTDKYPFFGNPICVSPRESSIVAFPSYLSHMTAPTRKSGLTRISIAFNVEV